MTGTLTDIDVNDPSVSLSDLKKSVLNIVRKEGFKLAKYQNDSVEGVAIVLCGKAPASLSISC